ncbi:MAG: putative Ig domain-containing protein [Eubacteriales bacterium]|nr:putative Ig domain-containing protein [Eubacteriales bacterium]
MPARLRPLTALLLLAMLVCLLPWAAQAGPAYPGPFTVKEPSTGISVTVYHGGDEFFDYMTDASDYVIVSAGGYFWYVNETDGAYDIGARVTGGEQDGAESRVQAAAAEELKEKLTALQLSLPDAYAVTLSNEVLPIPAGYSMTTSPQDAAYGRVIYNDTMSITSPPKESTCPLLVLHIQYDNLTGAFDDAAWHKRIFEDGVSQYYLSVSNGDYTYTPIQESYGTANDGVITVTLPLDAPLWARNAVGNRNTNNGIMAGLHTGSNGKSYCIFNESSLFVYGMLAAADYLPDLTAFDRNNDGFIAPTEIGILMVCTGFEASSNGSQTFMNQPAVWGHSWCANDALKATETLPASGQTMAVELNGVKLFKYVLMGEVAAGEARLGEKPAWKNARQMQFGIACHELGHDLGLMDLYNLSDSILPLNVNSLSLMGNGGWGKAAPSDESGSCPTYLDSYSKLFLNFATAQTVTQSGVYPLRTGNSPGGYNTLRIDTEEPDIYYLLENRQFRDFDKALMQSYNGTSTTGGGIVIWRVDHDAIQMYWSSNELNSHEDQYAIMPLFYDSDQRQPFWGGNYFSRSKSILLSTNIKLEFFGVSTAEMNVSVLLNFQPSGPIITTNVLPDTVIGDSYSVTLTAQSDLPVIWSLRSGRLPDGLSLENGCISGTVLSAGSYTVTLCASNGMTPDDFKTLTLYAAAARPPVILSQTLSEGTVGEYYSEPLSATGGGSYTWSILHGSLPDGITLRGDSLDGIPIIACTATFTVEVSNGVSPNAVQELTLTVTDGGEPIIQDSELPSGYASLPYHEQINVVGGRPLHWEIRDGSLPDGLTLTDGLVSGTPTRVGTYSFALRVSNSVGVTEDELSIVIQETPDPPVIVTDSLPDAILGMAYNEELVTQGNDECLWSVTGGRLPNGLLLIHEGISGIPTEAGLFTFTLNASNGVKPDAFVTLSLRVTRAESAPVLLEDALPDASIDEYYETDLSASGGGSQVWSIVGGKLPNGLTFANGTISGVPKELGRFYFTVMVSNGIGPDAVKEMTLTVGPPKYTITLLAVPQEGGQVTGGGVYPEDTPLLFTAYPNPDYRFVQWRELNPKTHEDWGEYSTYNPLEEKSYDDITLAAIFETVISILTEPTDQTALTGETALFTLTASGVDLRYQWYVDRNDGQLWQKLNWAVDSRYETSVLTPAQNGYRYFCRIIDSAGQQQDSRTAVLHVLDHPIPPQTGDPDSPLLWLELLLLSCAGGMITLKQLLKCPNERDKHSSR